VERNKTRKKGYNKEIKDKVTERAKFNPEKSCCYVNQKLL
jgi:hypothetical protein